MSRRRWLYLFSGAIAVFFWGNAAASLYSAQNEISENKALIRKIIAAPEYQRNLRNTDDLVRSASRSGVRSFLDRLRTILPDWNTEDQEKPTENDQGPGDISSYDFSPGFFSDLIAWLMRLEDSTLSLFVIIPLAVLISALFYALLRQGLKMRKTTSDRKKLQPNLNEEELREIFEKLLSQALYSKADPRLLPPALTHRQANDRLTGLTEKHEPWLEILRLMELYRFSPGQPKTPMRRKILAALQKFGSEK